MTFGFVIANLTGNFVSLSLTANFVSLTDCSMSRTGRMTGCCYHRCYFYSSRTKRRRMTFDSETESLMTMIATAKTTILNCFDCLTIFQTMSWSF